MFQRRQKPFEPPAQLQRGVRGKGLTPFLLSKLAEATEGKTLQANRALVVANASLAARLARECRTFLHSP